MYLIPPLRVTLPQVLTDIARLHTLPLHICTVPSVHVRNTKKLWPMSRKRKEGLHQFCYWLSFFGLCILSSHNANCEFVIQKGSSLAIYILGFTQRHQTWLHSKYTAIVSKQRPDISDIWLSKASEADALYCYSLTWHDARVSQSWYNRRRRLVFIKSLHLMWACEHCVGTIDSV